MEKLIELLNEYDEGGNWRKVHWKGLGCEDYDTIGYKDKELTCEQDEIVAYLISKTFGFIKWLVDNDKIDRDKVDKSWNEEMSFVDFKLDNIMEIRIKVMLMLLAINDSPIEFLISVLK